MKYSLKLLGILTLSAVSLVTSTQAETKPGAKPGATAAPAAPAAAETKPKRDTYPLYGEVVSINSSTLVIKGGVDKPDRTFAITKDTVIVNGEKPAKSGDVKTGAWVGGLLKKAAKGNDEVLKLNVDVKQKEAKAPAAAAPAPSTTTAPAKKKAA